MPYNTRRKSLSLPSLGIQLPHGSRAHPQTPPGSAKGEHHPSKKAKRSYSPLSTVQNVHEPTTPPLSPPPERRINYDDIDDEVVTGVVKALERSGNRPHTVRELAVILAPSINIVEHSTNPQAIISSRLNAYLKRGFTRSLPCLLKKELINTHPRRIYFYLTTGRHLPIPEREDDIAMARQGYVSPALSDEEEEDRRRRKELSPSPEVDLSSHELGDDDDAESDTNSILSSTTSSLIDRQRKRSPSAMHDRHATLEGDEREFSQSAIYMNRRRARAAEKKEAISPKRSRAEYETGHEHEHGDERVYEEAAASLLAENAPSTPVKNNAAVAEKQMDKLHPTAVELPHNPEIYSWNGEFERNLGSPESVDLDELDQMLDF